MCSNTKLTLATRNGKVRQGRTNITCDPVNNCNDGIEVGWGHFINIGCSEEVKGFGLILTNSFGYMQQNIVILDIAIGMLGKRHIQNKVDFQILYNAFSLLQIQIQF